MFRLAPPPASDPGARRLRFRTSIALRSLAVLLAMLVAAPPLAAQSGTISGVVTSEGQGAPIAGAQVTVVGTPLGAVTGEDGTFRITGVAGTQVTLEARRIGFRAVRQTVANGATEVRFSLPVSLINLSEVVVTGTPGATERRSLGNAVSTISAAEVVEKAPINSLQELLNARAAGVVIMPATGNVGSGARVRVRGSSSFSLNNQPLIYVDGVRVNSQMATGPQNQDFGSSSISRLNDINPEDIESIEILKGPAASTLYGTEASNGVIQIITRRGQSTAPRWNFMMKQGANYLADPEGRFETNWQIVGTDTVSLDIVEREKAAGRDIWRTGHVQEYDLSVSGGADLFSYYAGGSYELSEGVDRSNDVERYSTRANLSVRPSASLIADVSLSYMAGLTNLPCEAGCGGRVWGTVLADPRNLEGANADRRGFHSGTPEQYDLLEKFWQDVDRFTAGVQLRHSPLAWFSQRLNVGVDRTREENVSFTPRIDSLIGHSVWGNAPLGSRSQTERAVDMTTFDYAGTVRFMVMPTLSSATAFGGQYYSTSIDSIFAEGSVFPAPGLTAVSATTTGRLNAQDFLQEKSLGFFLQQEVGWRDRVYLTAGVRSDDHSAFGQNFDRVYYPKFSASWIISEEAFWTVPFVDALKLRAAYGESGQQPPNFAAIRTYEPVTGPGDVAAVTPQLFGNPDLGPERGREIELGFDAGFLGDRLGLELTYYDKRTEDAILERAIAPSIGFSGFQFFNAGEIRNRGLEVLARARAYESDDVNVEMSLTLATNDNEVVSLGEAGVEWLSAGTFLRHQVGYPVGSYFEQRIVSAEFDEVTRSAINVRCDDGAGGDMPCAGADGIVGNADDAPDVYLGRTTPDLEGAFSTTVTLWERVRLYALVDFKRGQTKLDGNTRVRCYFFGGRCRENFFPEEFDPKRIASIQSNSNYVDLWFADAGFTKLREVSATYMLPDRYAAAMRADRASVSIAGRNLFTWTNFPGLEPEAMFLGGSRGGQHAVWEQTTLPQLSQWIFTVNLGF